MNVSREEFDAWCKTSPELLDRAIHINNIARDTDGFYYYLEDVVGLAYDEYHKEVVIIGMRQELIDPEGVGVYDLNEILRISAEEFFNIKLWKKRMAEVSKAYHEKEAENLARKEREEYNQYLRLKAKYEPTKEA